MEDAPRLRINTELVRTMEDELFNKRNLGAIDTFIAPGYVLRTAATDAPAGRESVRDAIAAYVNGFSDLHVEVEELIASGDRVVAVLLFTGTHDAELFGIPPTGRRMRVRQIAIYRVENGQVAEEWEVSDQLSLMQQLGAFPESA